MVVPECELHIDALAGEKSFRFPDLFATKIMELTMLFLCTLYKEGLNEACCIIITWLVRVCVAETHLFTQAGPGV